MWRNYVIWGTNIQRAEKVTKMRSFKSFTGNCSGMFGGNQLSVHKHNCCFEVEYKWKFSAFDSTVVVADSQCITINVNGNMRPYGQNTRLYPVTLSAFPREFKHPVSVGFMQLSRTSNFTGPCYHTVFSRLGVIVDVVCSSLIIVFSANPVRCSKGCV